MSLKLSGFDKRQIGWIENKLHMGILFSLLVLTARFWHLPATQQIIPVINWKHSDKVVNLLSYTLNRAHVTASTLSVVYSIACKKSVQGSD